MNDAPRKKSPRAPSIALSEAIEAAKKIYEKERRHSAPVDVVSQHMGYKSANSGSALQALASLRYYGLIERVQQGQMAVVKDVESYQFAPSDDVRGELISRWLKTPPLFAELLDKYQESLPSDATLKFELINRGFLPDAAESVMAVFKSSVEFARYYERHRRAQELPSLPVAPVQPVVPQVDDDAESGAEGQLSVQLMGNAAGPIVDRIPVRLSGGRRAWLEIPSPFYAADKERLKNQIDLLLTEEDEQANALKDLL